MDGRFWEAGSAVSRRALLRSAPLSAAALGLGTAPGGFGPRAARAMGENAAPAEVNLEDLPRGAASAYKQSSLGCKYDVEVIGFPAISSLNVAT